MNPIQTLSEADLVLRLRGTEHDFVERKPLKQPGEWLQVAVAFANSTPVGYPAVLFVGSDDAGNPQADPSTLEDLAKSVNAVIERAYPPIYRDLRPLVIGGKGCLAVIIPGSASRPHFAGRAYVRNGPEVREASDEQFAELIASRSSKAREIQSWIGKEITWVHRNGALGDSYSSQRVTVAGCNSHYVTLHMWDGTERTFVQSEPLSRIELSFDDKRERLQIILYATR